MNIEKIRTLSELSAKILRSDEKVSDLNACIFRLNETNCNYTAKMELERGERRFTSYEQMTKEEIVLVLQRRLAEETKVIEALQKEYESLQ